MARGRDRVRRRRMLGLALPATASLVADPMLGLVDTAVIGRVGAVELGALGLAVAVLVAVSWVFNFLVYGTTATVARAVGAGDRDAAGRHVAHAAYLAVGLGVTVAVALFVTAPAILRGLGAVPELVGPAATYLRIRALGVPFFLLNYVGHGAFRGVSDTRTPLVVSAVMVVLNGALDVILVLVLGFGLAGAAWATVSAEVVAAVAFAVLLRRAKGLPLRGHRRPTPAELRALVSISRDLFLRTAGLMAGFLAVTSAAARIGAVTAAAHQILWQVWIVVALFLDGIAIAAQAMVGTALGARDEDEARAVGRMLLRWGAGSGLAIALGLLVLSGVVPRALTDDQAVLALAATAWWLAAAGQVVNGPVFALDGVLMGAADFGYLRTWTIAGAVVAAALAQVAVVAGWGLLGLWVAIQAMMVVRFVSLVARLRGGAWSHPGPHPPRVV